MKVLKTIVSVLMALFLTVGVCSGKDRAKEDFNKAVEYGVQGKFKEAKEEFEKALNVDPFYTYAEESLKVIGDVTDQKIRSETAIHFFKGAAYVNKGMPDEGIAEFKKVIIISPNYALAYDARGVAHEKGKGEYDQAISDYNKAIEVNPRLAGAYNHRGIAYMDKGQYDHAISDYNKAMEINTRDAKAYYNRGIAYAKGKGQYDQVYLISIRH